MQSWARVQVTSETWIVGKGSNPPYATKIMGFSKDRCRQALWVKEISSLCRALVKLKKQYRVGCNGNPTIIFTWCGSSVGRARDWKSLCRRFDSSPHHKQIGQFYLPVLFFDILVKKKLASVKPLVVRQRNRWWIDTDEISKSPTYLLTEGFRNWWHIVVMLSNIHS